MEGLKVEPEGVLTFLLHPDVPGNSHSHSSDRDKNENTSCIPKCIMTLRHPNTTDAHLAFKVS